MLNMTKIYIDTRELSHPKPMEMAMKILQTLEKNSYLYMLHKREPHPLIDLAKENNFKVLRKEDKKNNWHILISHNLDINLDDYLDKEYFNV